MNLNRTSRSLGGAFQRVSSGLRINKAADDAAGMGVQENLSTAVGSSRIAMRNTNDGVSVVQIAEGAATEVINIVKRMRELAVQSASETLHKRERLFIQDEYEQLEREVDRVSQVTDFNGKSLGDGSITEIEVQVGINNTVNDRITIGIGDLRSTTLGVDTAGISMITAGGAQAAIQRLDKVLHIVNRYRSTYGAAESQLGSSLRNMGNYAQNMSSAQSQIQDADFAFETAQIAKQQIMQQAGVSVLAQSNSVNQGALTLL
jgi:flagellin